ncbi:hypothetical protein BT96DRAFT_970656 [Gymnopus androsaceus JB14]|uniref:AB hydrolase-1 domain-containing protein n=1 Tax=Gymnopus androsaceus JB14 TaxID=1447944 RepID=A0A6A4IHR6_9AGAR|nr:hypothetical protein BT96DRAFT_970656 [Gymnopus androsaceus JB14]
MTTNNGSYGSLIIREAWALDVQNHGQTARLNEKITRERPEALVATAVILATTFFPVPSLYPRIFHSLILVEPALVPPKYIDPSQHTPLFRSISKLMASRKDTWASKDEARAWMENRLPWGAWDERVLRIYIEYGLETKGAMGKSVLPIHVVWGEVDDLFSREVKDSLEDREQGRVFTTVRRVEDVGHMMVQMAPQATAKALWDIFVEPELGIKSRL